MKIKTSNIIPPQGFIAINLFGVVFVRPGTILNSRTINHEMIHTAQMREMCYLFFYLWYGLEWIVRLVQYRNLDAAYRNISFEREAYSNDSNLEYMNKRKLFSWLRLEFTPKNRR